MRASSIWHRVRITSNFLAATDIAGSVSPGESVTCYSVVYAGAGQSAVQLGRARLSGDVPDLPEDLPTLAVGTDGTDEAVVNVVQVVVGRHVGRD